MNVTYVVETTSGCKWEMAAGVYVVNAKSKKEAQEIVEEGDRFGKQDFGVKERVSGVTRVDKRKKGIVFKQDPVIE